MKTISIPLFATLVLLGSVAVPVASQADPLLAGQISTLVRTRFNVALPDSVDGGTVALLTGAHSYAASETRGDYFVSSTGATQISNNDGADVAKIGFTGATNLSAKDAETDLALTDTQISVLFSVTAPVTFLIQGDFKGEISEGDISAHSSSSLVDKTSSPLQYLYLEHEGSYRAGVFHQMANLTNDGNDSGSLSPQENFFSEGALTGVLMPGYDYYLYQGFTVAEGYSSVGVSGLSLGNYSITFTRLTDDGSGGGGGNGGGSGGGGGGGGTSTVPDGGSSVGLVFLGLVALAVIRRRYRLFPVSLMPA